MSRYKAFISYRKKNATNADLIKTVLTKEYDYTTEDIFLDKHNIGPEYFDTKLKQAIKDSSSFLLLVTKDCFVPKEKEDWYIEEIKEAIGRVADKGIKIIPILFDDIKSLSEDEIVKQLKMSFTDAEIDVLKKSEAIRYDFDYSDSAFSKISSFINQANVAKYNILYTILLHVIIFASVCVVAFVFFVGIGFLWGYAMSSQKPEKILVNHTAVEGYTAVFDFCGLEARYDLMADSIHVNLTDFVREKPQSAYDTFVQSCSISGAITLFNKNLKYIKYVKNIKPGSKQGAIMLAGATAAVCIGSFCGFSQGKEWGRAIKQQDNAMNLYQMLRYRSKWRPVFADNIVLNNKYETNLVMNSLYTKTYVYPDSLVTIARDKGLVEFSLLLRFNEWEIGKQSARSLQNVITNSKDREKVLIFMEGGDADSIKRIELPAGIVGIRFSTPAERSDIQYAYERYENWKNTHDNIVD